MTAPAHIAIATGGNGEELARTEEEIRFCAALDSALQNITIMP